jgi:hypothetical protein
MRDYEKHVLDVEAHVVPLLWFYRIVPHRSYVKGWKISPRSLPQSGPRDGLARPVNA